MPVALLFDLDETLVLEEPAAVAAFEATGDEDDLRALREWAPAYRRDAWAGALAAQGVADLALAAELGERFGRSTCSAPTRRS